MDRAPMDIRVVLFDVGGVLINARPDAREVAATLGLNPDSAECVELVDKAMWFHRDAYDAGITDREFWDAVAGDCGLGELSDDMIAALVRADVARMEHADPGALELVRDLRHAGREIGILSNAPAAISAGVRATAWARELFDHTVFSSDSGICKPHRGIYREALAVANVEPKHMVFIDDRAENLRAAELLGIRGILWTEPALVREDLTELGAL